VKVVVAGGTGYVGRALVGSLLSDGYETVIVSRDPRQAGEAQVVSWSEAPGAIDGATAVVNVAGASIGGPRWTERRKKTILASRVQTTTRLVNAIAAAADPPSVFVCASGIGFAGDSGDAPVDETTPYGESFLARVCAEWEAASARAPVRHVEVRTGLVVGPGAPAIRMMALPFRLFVGGRVGSGRQWFPWIHLDDVVRIYREAIADASLAGPVNAVAPELVRQCDAAKALGSVLHRPARLPLPEPPLRLLLGEQADLLLHGQRATSRRLSGFEFHYRGLRAALADALA
jgi:uncharacterized protein (TIGR01777 family)